jgi:hypothetical protein
VSQLGGLALVHRNRHPEVVDAQARHVKEATVAIRGRRGRGRNELVLHELKINRNKRPHRENGPGRSQKRGGEKLHDNCEQRKNPRHHWTQSEVSSLSVAVRIATLCFGMRKREPE